MQMDNPNLKQMNIDLQDLYAEIRYLTYLIEGVAKSLRDLVPEEQ